MTEPHNAHIAAWWANRNGNTGQSHFEQQISLALRDEFRAFIEDHLDREDRLGERVEPLGILSALDLPDIKVMRYAGVPSYDGVQLPLGPEFARHQREERNERAIAWLRHATGRDTSGGVLLTPEVIERAVLEAEAGYPLTRLKSRRHGRTD